MTDANRNLPSTRHYAVFLSYRHADNKEAGRQWASWLHHLLEGYEIPADLVGKLNGRGDPIPAGLYPVFRDEEELPADADLTRNIRQALENSDLLVVLCSPRAVESRFVADEIRYFKNIGRPERILALIIDGEPNASDDPGKAMLGIGPGAECLPEPLRFGVAGEDGAIDWTQRTEPIAADVRPEGKPEQGWTTGAAYRDALQKQAKGDDKEIARKVHEYEQRLELAKLKVVAGSLGVPLGELTRRDKAMQLDKARKRARTLRRWLFAVGILTLCAISAGIFAYLKAQAERRQRLLAQQATARVQKAEGVIQQDAAAAHQSASTADFSVANNKMEQGDPESALPYLADALRQNPSNQAAIALTVSLLRANPFLPTTLHLNAPVFSASFSPDGRYVLTSSGNAEQLWIVRNGVPAGSIAIAGSGIRLDEFVSASKELVAVQTQNGAAQLWDPRMGKPAGPLIALSGRSAVECLSANGARALTASRNGAQVWDLRTGKPLRALLWTLAPNEYMNSLSCVLSTDGNRAAISWENKFQVWDAGTGKSLSGAIQMPDQVVQTKFSGDGKRLLIVYGGDSDNVEVWDVEAAKPVGHDIEYYDLIHFAAFSPSGNRLLTVQGGQYERSAVTEKVQAQVWDVKTGNAIGNPIAHLGSINSAQFSPDGRWVLTASDDKTARIWDARTGDPVGYPMRHAAKVNSASFSPDGKWVVTASADNTARIWMAQTGYAFDEAGRYPNAAQYPFALSTGGWRLVTGWSDHTARVWNLQTGKLVARTPPFANSVLSVAFSPDGTRVLSTSAGPEPPTVLRHPAEARLWDARTGRLIGAPMRHADEITSASFSPDGKFVLTSSRDDTARIWDAATGKPASPPMRCAAAVSFAAFSSDGKRVLTGSAGGLLNVWDPQSPQHAMMQTRLGNSSGVTDNPTAGQFSPDGTLILAVSDTDVARLWDSRTGQPVASPMLNGDLIHLAAFTPDGKGLLTVIGSVAQVWDLQTGKALTEPMQEASMITQAAFTKDGRWLIAAPLQGVVRIWDAQTGKAVSQASDSMGDSQFFWSLSSDAKWAYGSGNGVLTQWRWEGLTQAATAPPWLADLAEAASGLEVLPNGVLQPSPRDPRAVIQSLENLTGSDDLSRFGRWFVANPGLRAISPRSPVTVPQFVAQCLKENTADALNEAYLLDPGDPLLMASLAKFETDKDEALFLCRHALDRARAEYPPTKIAQVLSITRSIFPNVPEFSDASGASSHSNP